MDKHFRAYSAVFPIILESSTENTKILLQRRQNTGYEDGKWDVAGGGHVDEGETAQSALIRECKEELGIEVKREDMKFAHLQHRLSNRTYYDIYFFVNKYSGTPTIMEPEKSSDLKWFDIHNLPMGIVECRKMIVEGCKDKHYYSERIEL